MKKLLLAAVAFATVAPAFAGTGDMKSTVARCVAETRQHTDADGDAGRFRDFDAYYTDADASVHNFGSQIARFLFGKCMAEHGQPLAD